MNLTTKNIPLYFQLYLKLRQDIIRGDLAPGLRLGGVGQMGRELGLSQGTVRRALDQLQKEGLIEKQRGRGTFVTHRQDAQPPEPVSVAEELESANPARGIERLEEGWIVPPARVRKALWLGEGEKVFWIKRLNKCERDPLERGVVDMYIPAGLYERVGRQRLVEWNFRRVLNALRLASSVRVEQVLRPWLADLEAASHLGMPEGTPVFHRTIVLTQLDSTPIIMNEALLTRYAVRQVYRLTYHQD